MAEHDSDREDREPDEKGVPFDEAAAWAAIVAAYGEEPADPPGARPFKPIEDLALPEPEQGEGADGREGGRGGEGRRAGGGTGPGDGRDERGAEDKGDHRRGDGAEDGDDHGDDGDRGGRGPSMPLGSSVSFAVGVGPRDYSPAEPSDDLDEDDEGHFVPPEPPPLPEADTTAKFAWLGVVGGPVLLLLAVVLGWDMTWWLTTLGIGGFLGGFVTLVMRMKTDDDEPDDPGRGAVV